MPPPRRDPPVRPEKAPLLVVVAGPPGAGKTTVARALADELDLPLVEKDTYKELVGGALSITERRESMLLGGGVFELMAHVVRDLLRRRVSVVAEGNFADTATIFRDLPPCRIVQVHVTAAPDVLRARLRSRDRHGVHYDAAAADEIADRAARGDWGPAPLDGELVRVDTTDAFPDVSSIVSRSVFS